MRKTYLSALLAVVLCLVVSAFFGCSKTVKITDIAGYTDMQAGGDKIEVCFENGTRYGFTFTIEDRAQIDEIVDLVLAADLTKVRNAPVAPGDNTHFIVFQGSESYRIQLSGVPENDCRYIFSTNDLRNKIDGIAEEYGAFDTENND